jgi:hypothetical protein
VATARGTRAKSLCLTATGAVFAALMFNNLIKRIKRVGFGFRNFDNYRIRALLYAGKPNWRVLGSIVVR